MSLGGIFVFVVVVFFFVFSSLFHNFCFNFDFCAIDAINAIERTRMRFKRHVMRNAGICSLRGR